MAALLALLCVGWRIPTRVRHQPAHYSCGKLSQYKNWCPGIPMQLCVLSVCTDVDSCWSDVNTGGSAPTIVPHPPQGIDPIQRYLSAFIRTKSKGPLFSFFQKLTIYLILSVLCINQHCDEYLSVGVYPSLFVCLFLCFYLFVYFYLSLCSVYVQWLMIVRWRLSLGVPYSPVT